ncbi:MAG: preprotein translocase subunit SecG [Clostridia bacterium]|nr:preprotein translocase subunit SecG [Clostridia bacterium]MBR2054700.1 preprotein translocase subunit SecG [Clostridia bacterium]
MEAISVIVNILMVIASLALIVSVLMQSSDDNGMNALSGATSESFFSKNKMSTLEGKLAMVTKVSAIAFVVLALIALIIPG